MEVKSSVEPCSFCHRPITPEFVYRKPTAANRGLCTRKDCRKARRREAEQEALREADQAGEASAASIRLQETGHEEGDATTDASEDTPGVQYDHVVKTDLLDDDTPKLLKVRLVTGSNGENELLEAARRAAHLTSQHPAQPRREVINPPVDHRAHVGRDIGARELQERVKEIENSSSSKPKWSHGYAAEQLRALERFHKQENGNGRSTPTPSDAPTSETLAIDGIRNDWLTEKVKGDQEGQRVARQLLLNDVKPLPANAQIDELSLRLLCKLTPRDLAHLINDEKFCRPFVAEDSPQRWVIKDLWKDIRGEKQKAEQPETKLVSVVGPDGVVQERVCTVVPMSKGHQRRTRRKVSVLSGVTRSKPNMTTALTDAETSFYKDLAACNLTVLEMVEKHGAWSDDEIVELENRIIHHAVKVRLMVLPSSASDNIPSGYSPYQLVAIAKSRGEEIGGQIHGVKRGGKYDNQRPLDSFRTPLPHTTGSDWSPSGGSSGPEHDDHGEDSSA